MTLFAATILEVLGFALVAGFLVAEATRPSGEGVGCGGERWDFRTWLLVYESFQLASKCEAK